MNYREQAWQAFEAKHPTYNEWTLYRHFWSAVAKITGRRAAWGAYTPAEWRRVAKAMMQEGK